MINIILDTAHEFYCRYLETLTLYYVCIVM